MAQQQDTARPHVVVIGAGITGLSAAHRVCELGAAGGRAVAVTVVDARDRPGGVIHTVHHDGFVIDTGPDNFVTSKPGAVKLVGRLGLGDQLQNTNPDHRSALVARRGRLLPIPEGFLLMAPSRMLPMAVSPLFSWRGKLRMAMEPFIRARRDVDDESLASFVTRRLGREALDRLVQPLVGGIYSADPNMLSVRATLPRFLDMEAEVGSLIRAMRRNARRLKTVHTAARYSLFVTLRDGLSTLIEALVGRIGPEHVRCGAPVDRIVPRAGGAGPGSRAWSVHLADGPPLEADAVIVACPTHAAAVMLRDVDGDLAAGLAAIAYSSSAVVHFGLRRDAIAHPLDAFGFVVPHVEGLDILAASFTSVKYPGRAPDGSVLVRAFLGGALQPEVLQRDDDALAAAALRDLGPLLGLSGAPSFHLVHRWPRSMAQYRVGHLGHVARLRQRLAARPGLAMAGNGFEGVGIPDCVSDGERAAEAVVAGLLGDRAGPGASATAGLGPESIESQGPDPCPPATSTTS